MPTTAQLIALGRSDLVSALVGLLGGEALALDRAGGARWWGQRA